MTVSDRRRGLEILAVAITGALKYFLMDWLELRGLYIGVACLFWAAFILNRYRQHKDILKDWGLRKVDFKPAFAFLLPYALVLTAAIILYGLSTNATFLNWHVIPIFIGYPAWGLIQQFLMVSLVAGNLRSISKLHLKDRHIIVLTSLLFALVHYPSLPLMAFAFVMEVGFVFAYFKWKNIWPLGLYHGWIATMLLYFVMGRDLWNELWPVI